MRWVRIL